MDYAMKRKLIEKRREIVQRARRAAISGKMSATSTSIFTTKNAFNFNDVLKAEKETHKRK